MEPLDLGAGVELRFFAVEVGGPHAGATVWFGCDRDCGGTVWFDTPEARAARPTAPKWTVEAWDPLTLTPSLLCQLVGTDHQHHGHIRNGRWEEC